MYINLKGVQYGPRVIKYMLRFYLNGKYVLHSEVLCDPFHNFSKANFYMSWVKSYLKVTNEILTSKVRMLKRDRNSVGNVTIRVKIKKMIYFLGENIRLYDAFRL